MTEAVWSCGVLGATGRCWEYVLFWIFPSLTEGTGTEEKFCSATSRSPANQNFESHGSRLNFALSRDICAAQIPQPAISITCAVHGGRMPMILLQAQEDALTFSLTGFGRARGRQTCAGVSCCHSNSSHLRFHLWSFSSCRCFDFAGVAHATFQRVRNLNQTGQPGLGGGLERSCLSTPYLVHFLGT